MRVFVPVTDAGLADLARTGELGPAPLVGYAVTAALRESYRDGDAEELAYVAMTRAARAALLLLADEPAGPVPPRRTVLAIDSEDVHRDPGPDDEPGRVRVDRPVPLRRVAAAHVDTEDATAAVAAAVAMLRDGGPRDGDEQFLLDECEAHELAWYATQELPGLVR